MSNCARYFAQASFTLPFAAIVFFELTIHRGAHVHTP